MNFVEFEEKIYYPILKIVNGKKVTEMTESQRMVLAIENCKAALIPCEYAYYYNTMKDLEEIDNNARQNKALTRDEIIIQQAKVWNVSSEDLIENIKILFS